jgi:hypothetical protein
MTLPRNEALVLFEWLARLDEPGAPAIGDPAVEKVLWQLEGQLETALVEPFQDNYRQLLAEARRQVLEKYGD